MSFWRTIPASAVILLLFAATVAAAAEPDVQHALQQLLGLPSGDRGADAAAQPMLMPSYMMGLYERYKSGEMLGTKQGNTVRSINAVNDKKMANRLLFNLSGIHHHERVLKAELHLFRSPKMSELKNSERPTSVKLFAVDSDTNRQRRIETVVSNGFSTNGWSVYDVTEGVRELMRSTSHSSAILAVRTWRHFRKFVGLRRLMSEFVPFLIVFSQDRNSLQSDTMSDKPRVRQIRSLFDNRVNEDDFGSENEFPNRHVSKNHPGLLLPRKKSKFRPTRHPPFGKHQFKTDVVRQMTQKSRNDARDTNLCRRKKLVVDFGQIGWGKWIIFPKSFDAYYCAGACPFPLTKNVNPSNHATIQSLVHALGVSQDIPAPCCVPSAMSSMSLLYLDQDGDVVLKNYPQMTVESCACR